MAETRPLSSTVSGTDHQLWFQQSCWGDGDGITILTNKIIILRGMLVNTTPCPNRHQHLQPTSHLTSWRRWMSAHPNYCVRLLDTQMTSRIIAKRVLSTKKATEKTSKGGPTIFPMTCRQRRLSLSKRSTTIDITTGSGGKEIKSNRNTRDQQVPTTDGCLRDSLLHQTVERTHR